MKLRDDELLGFAGVWHKAQPFVNGSVAASIALLFVQPADVFKMR